MARALGLVGACSETGLAEPIIFVTKETKTS